MVIATTTGSAKSCRSKQGETISYSVNGMGRDRKTVVSYHRQAVSYATDVDLLTSFKEANFERRGRDIDVTFSLNRTLGPKSMMSLSEPVEIPFPLELSIMPKGYTLKNVKLNVYTQLDNDKPVLKCKKELKYHCPAKLNWRERAMNYLGLNEIFRKAFLKE